MRASCSGCRALRKGCADDCTIRPCLAWIRSPDAQANATVFLAKFYGRAGLINLLRVSPASFKRASSSSSSSAARPKRDGGLDEEADGSHGHVVEDDGKALAAEQKRGQSSSSEAEADSHVSQPEQSASATVPQVAQDDGEIGLELTLGFGPATRVLRSSPPVRFEASSLSAESGHIGLLLGLPV